MNLILHHFKKEFRYLRHRWFAFLGLLGLDLAVNLEWLFPLRAGVEPPAWLGYLPWVLILAGATLLGSCPEDKPGSDRSFISTRPLPLRAYWLARVLCWLALLLLPVMLQNAVYLTLSGRSIFEVLLGAGWRGLYALALSAWVLPMTTLWRRGEFWTALACLGVFWYAALKLVNFATEKWGELHDFARYYQIDGGRIAGWLVFALGILWLAWLGGWLRRPAGYWPRLLACAGIALAGLLTARVWSGHFLFPPQDEALARKLASEMKLEFDASGYQYERLDTSSYDTLYGRGRMRIGVPGVSATLWPLATKIHSAGTPALDASVTPRYRTLPFIEINRHDTVVRDLFPSGTAFVRGGVDIRESRTPVAKFQQPHPDPDKSLRFEIDYEVSWFQRHLELDIPLQVGSEGRSDAVSWRVLHVEHDKDKNGNPDPGMLSVELHVQALKLEKFPHNTSGVLLYSPRKQMVWCRPDFSNDPRPVRATHERASRTGWERYKARYGWRVSSKSTSREEIKEEISQLRLILLRCRYLGASESVWQSPEIRLADISPGSRDALRRQTVYRGREDQVFRERFASLRAPGADSSEQEARRYLYDLLVLTHATGMRDAPEVVAAFRALMERHLPLMLEMPADFWPWPWRSSGESLASMLDEYITEAQRDAVIGRLLTNPELLAGVIVRKGWAEAARRVQSQLLSLPRLPDGTEDLLLAWGDEASYDRLLLAYRRFENWRRPNMMDFIKFDRVPALRPRLEKLADEVMRECFPQIANGMPYNDLYHTTANFGSRDALNISLRWIALGSDWPLPERRNTPHPHLLDQDGTSLWKKDKPEKEQYARYLQLRAEDFEYLPEQRAWRIRQP